MTTSRRCTGTSTTNQRLHPLWAVLLLIGALAVQVPAWSLQKLSAAEIQTLLAQGKQLVVASKMVQAYELLAPHEFQLAGKIFQRFVKLLFARNPLGHVELAANPVCGIEQGNPVATFCGNAGECQAGGTGAHHRQ